MNKRTSAIKALCNDVSYRKSIVAGAMRNFVRDTSIPIDERWIAYTKSGMDNYENRRLTAELNCTLRFSAGGSLPNTFLTSLHDQLRRRIGNATTVSIQTVASTIERSLLGQTFNGAVVDREFLDAYKAEIMSRSLMVLTM